MTSVNIRGKKKDVVSTEVSDAQATFTTPDPTKLETFYSVVPNSRYLDSQGNFHVFNAVGTAVGTPAANGQQTMRYLGVLHTESPDLIKELKLRCKTVTSIYQ